MKRTILTLTAAALLTSGLGLQASAENSRMILTKSSKTTVQTLETGKFKAKYVKSLNCSVAGTPVEFPNDIAIWSKNGPIAAGTVISWNVPGTVINGTAILPAVAQGKAHYIQNAIPGGLVAGTPCSAKSY